MKVNNKIVLGKIIGVHGLNGNVKIRVFTKNPNQLMLYSSLNIGKLSQIKFKKVSLKKDILLCSVNKFINRTDAEKYIGIDVWLKQEHLINFSEVGYYHKDLLGFLIKDVNENNLGKIRAIHNFGAGDIIELDSNYPSMIRFDKNNIGKIDLKEKYMNLLRQLNLLQIVL